MHQTLKRILLACVLSIFSHGAYAQTKVVVIPMDGDTSTKKTVFITSTLYYGDLVTEANALNDGTTYTDGLTAGDALCQSRADAAGLDGTYKAWLSTSSSDAIRMLSKTAGPWYRTDGVKVGDYEDFVNETLEAIPHRDEYGNEPDPYVTGSGIDPNYAWTGTGGDGGTRNNNTGTYTCNDWTDATDSYYGTSGDAETLTYYWTYSDDYECNEYKQALYCFEY